MRPSNPYSFEYKLNIGKYDSIYFFGEYPGIEELKRERPELYKSYKKHYSSFVYNYNSRKCLFTHNLYVLYALFKNNKVQFWKTKRYSQGIKVSFPGMARKNQKFIVSGYNAKAGTDIFPDVYLEPVDSIYRVKLNEFELDSMATDN